MFLHVRDINGNFFTRTFSRKSNIIISFDFVYENKQFCTTVIGWRYHQFRFNATVIYASPHEKPIGR